VEEGSTFEQKLIIASKYMYSNIRTVSHGDLRKKKKSQGQASTQVIT
jgi:hypothetical protein